MKITFALHAAVGHLLVSSFCFVGTAEATQFSYTYDLQVKTSSGSPWGDAITKYCLETSSNGEIGADMFPRNVKSNDEGLTDTIADNSFGGVSAGYAWREKIKKQNNDASYKTESCSSRCSTSTMIGHYFDGTYLFSVNEVEDCITEAPTAAPTTDPKYYQSSICTYQAACYENNDEYISWHRGLYCVQIESDDPDFTYNNWSGTYHPEDFDMFLFSWPTALWDNIYMWCGIAATSDLSCLERSDEIHNRYSSEPYMEGAQECTEKGAPLQVSQGEWELWYCGNDAYRPTFITDGSSHSVPCGDRR